MIAAFALCVFLAASSAHTEYAERGKFVLAPSGALDIGLYGYANPALLSYVEGLEQGVAWSDSSSVHRAGLGRSYCPRPSLERPTRRAVRPRRPNRGLEAAIALAKEKIGLSADAIVELMERPRPKLFSPAFFRPRLLGLAAQPTPELDYLQFRLQHNGLPLLLVPAHHVARRKTMSKEARALYADMGATPVINALGPRTLLGGSSPHPDLIAAMELAGRYYVDMDAFLASTGRIVADLLGAEAALITPGCAAALVLGTAACLTGADPKKMARLPDATGMPNQVVIQKAQRYKYDRMVRLPGGILVEAGTEQGTTADELAAAFGPQTAALLYPAIDNPAAIVPLATAIDIAHAHDVPVFVDAAFRVYPLDGLTQYIAAGADLVGYGAKYVGAPNSSGILCGRADLIEAAHLHSFACFETRDLEGVGRPLKIDRQEVVGVVVALRRWLAMDHDARNRGDARRAETVRQCLGQLPHVQSSVHGASLTLTLDEQALGRTAADLEEALRNGNPAVWLSAAPGQLHLSMPTVADGDEELLAAQLKKALSS